MPRPRGSTKARSGTKMRTAGRGRAGRPPSQPQSTASPNTQSPATPVPSAPGAPLQTEDPLAKLLQRESEAVVQLNTLEKCIYDYETSYLTNTVRGNAVKGYAGWLTSGLSQSQGGAVREEDRLFSRSSVSGDKHLQTQKLEQGGGEQEG